MSTRRLIGFRYDLNPEFIDTGRVKLASPGHYASLESLRRDEMDAATQSRIAGDFHLGNGMGSSYDVDVGGLRIRFVDCAEGRVEGAEQIVRRSSREPWVFCMSASPSNTFGDALRRQTVYRVEIGRLCAALRIAAPELIGPAIVRQVVYKDRSDEAALGEPDPFLKDVRFRRERELRLAMVNLERAALDGPRDARPPKDDWISIDLGGPRPDIFRKIWTGRHPDSRKAATPKGAAASKRLMGRGSNGDRRD